MSGWLGDLSADQATKLEKFRRRLQDVLKEEHDDHCLLRYLRARAFDLKESEAMFRKAKSWRESMKVDAIYKNFEMPKVCEMYWCGGLVGHDKVGSPIYIVPLGNLDMKGLMHSCRTSEMVKIIIYYLEQVYKDLEEQSKMLGRNVEGLILLFDFEGVGAHHLWKPGIDLFNEFLTLFEQYYPEIIKTTYVLKPPKIFPIIFALVRPFLRERTKQKIQILGSNWREVLLKHIDANELPEFWGGTRHDPDGNPKCPSQGFLNVITKFIDVCFIRSVVAVGVYSEPR
ncbi:SEC14-like protein 2 [Acanthaster planci]|uniref:SEC14-like protein 2 n=1 Tax=Acanthaster planci TaxID=133434 RepID=A0A8B7YKT1_ACAPL|nr:SEC14-like protein 2 [Acanthaster planci]